MLHEILVVCRERNAKVDVTGALYYENGLFIQCLEGEESAVKLTYDRIKKDTRHREIKLFNEEIIDKPEFSRWHMALVTPDEAKQILKEQSLPEFNADNVNNMTGDQL